MKEQGYAGLDGLWRIGGIILAFGSLEWYIIKRLCGTKQPMFQQSELGEILADLERRIR